MQKYIAPVRTMLGDYKQAIVRIREDQRLLTRGTEASDRENVCPNTVKIGRSTTKIGRSGTRNGEDMSMRKLDMEIE